jgi:hypothetical protein
VRGARGVKEVEMRIAAVLAAVAAFVAVPTANAYPKPEPRALSQPFTGNPVTSTWYGRWRVSGGVDDGVSWRIFATASPACRAVTAGRTTCFILRPPGQTDEWAGAITLQGKHVIFRMTYRPRPNTLGCFTDDPYTYRLTARRISLLKGGTHSCFWEPTANFPITLKRVA